MSAAAVEVDQHNLASTHNINLLENGARPSGAVIFKPKDDGGFAVNLSESQRQQLLTDLNNRFTGTGNAGRPMLLEGDFDWKQTLPCGEESSCGSNQVLENDACVCGEGFYDCDNDGTCLDTESCGGNEEEVAVVTYKMVFDEPMSCNTSTLCVLFNPLSSRFF